MNEHEKSEVEQLRENILELRQLRDNYLKLLRYTLSTIAVDIALQKTHRERNDKYRALCRMIDETIKDDAYHVWYIDDIPF